MDKKLKPGENPGNDGGIFQGVGPRGGKKDYFATIPDNHIAPPPKNQGISGCRLNGRLIANESSCIKNLD